MTQEFTSVTLFYVAVREALLSAVGMTIERTLGSHDLILTNGAGGLARLRLVEVSPTVSALSLELGTDPDVLSVSSLDPETCLPFSTVSPDSISASIDWWPERGVLQFFIVPHSVDPTTPGQLRCYRAEFTIATQLAVVSHEDPPTMEFAPNFKASGGPYLQIGV